MSNRKVVRLVVVAAALAGLTASLAAASSSWVRRETQHWVVYVPNDDWNVVDGKNGTDITSPLGELYVALAFAAWNYPLKTSDIVNYAIRVGTLDAHPLANLKVVAQGRPTYPRPGQTQQVYTWTGFRTNRNERARGVYKVNVFNSPSTGEYAYSAWTRVAPAAVWNGVSSTLLSIQNRITYKPRSNAACRNPGCRPLR